MKHRNYTIIGNYLHYIRAVWVEKVSKVIFKDAFGDLGSKLRAINARLYIKV